MLFQFLYFSFLFIVPIYLLDILAISPLKSGYFLLFLAVPFVFLSKLIGKISDKIGSEVFVILSFLIAVFAFYLLTKFDTMTQYSKLILPFVLVGVSSAFMFNSSTSIALKIAPIEKKGVASGIFFTNTLIGGANGVSVTGLLLSHVGFIVSFYYYFIPNRNNFLPLPSSKFFSNNDSK